MKFGKLICIDFGGTLWRQINKDIFRNFKYFLTKKLSFFKQQPKYFSREINEFVRFGSANFVFLKE